MKKYCNLKKLRSLKKSSNFAKTCAFFALQIDICWRIDKIVVCCMTKHVLSMPIKFEVDSLIFLRIITAAIFENAVSKKMCFKL